MRTLDVGVLLPGEMDGIHSAVVNALASNDCTARVLDPRSGRLHVECDFLLLCGPMASLWHSLEYLRKLCAKKPRRVIVWYTEPLPNPMWQKWLSPITKILSTARYRTDHLFHQFPQLRPFRDRAGRLRGIGEMREIQRLGALDLVAVFTSRHKEFFERIGIPALVIPMGYYPALGRPLGTERDIDVVFIGSTAHSRRGSMIADLSRRLAERGVAVVVKDGSAQHGSVYGTERTRLINRSKIMLSIMRRPWDDPVFRILLAAPNGAMVLSEPVLDAGPFQPGVHFAEAGGDLADAICHYLQAPDQRTQIAETAYDHVVHRLTMSQMSRKLLEAWLCRVDERGPVG